jgi:hypothetical protein
MSRAHHLASSGRQSATRRGRRTAPRLLLLPLISRFAISVAAVVSGGSGLAGPATANDTVIMRPGGHAFRIGAYSPFAAFRNRLDEAQRLCPPTSEYRPNADKPLELAAGTARTIIELTSCEIARDLPEGSEARRGAITRDLWMLVAPDVPLPDLSDRVESLTLSFEATDFSDPPAWNFCQDNPVRPDERAASVLAGAPCYNATDPCSMLTWGPRGATAGQGAEIQWILWQLHLQSPALLSSAFGAEHADMLRFLTLRRPPATTCDGSTPVDMFMCAVWVDPVRQARWNDALLQLGGSGLARKAYRAVYAALEFDGYKMQQYEDLWRRLGLQVSEADYAFFFDRATHIGSPPERDAPSAAAMTSCLDAETGAASRNAAARRCLSLAHPHPSQPIDRLGRDVAYYLAAYPHDKLSERERHIWQHHIPIDALTQLDLSDARPVAPTLMTSQPAPEQARPPGTGESVTEAERSCPLRIRNPLRRRP